MKILILNKNMLTLALSWFFVGYIIVMIMVITFRKPNYYEDEKFNNEELFDILMLLFINFPIALIIITAFINLILLF